MLCFSHNECMHPPFDTQKAQHYSHILMKQLDDGIYPTSLTCEGRMYGILVAVNEAGEEVILQAFSGRMTLPGWVQPALRDEEFKAIIGIHDEAIHRLTELIAKTGGKKQESELEHQRKALSNESLHTLNVRTLFHCIDEKPRSLDELFGSHPMPTGTGDCCAPKLLNHAFKHHLHPVSMAEFYYGQGSREHKQYYGPCDEKCRPLLSHMLGLDIIYQDEAIVVVEKPSGLLSVPGRGEDNKDSVETRLSALFPNSITQSATHRLDMDTSGLMVLARTKQAHRNLNIQFSTHQVKKTYVALLEGVVKQKEGDIELPFRLDVEHRPHQIYDEVNGKWGLTHFERLGVELSCQGRLATRVLFTPKTGRTHQLRLHSSHEKGLAHPILGDRLYGETEDGCRLHLHANFLAFKHPDTDIWMEFNSPIPF